VQATTVGCVSVEHWWDIHVQSLFPASVVVLTGLLVSYQYRQPVQATPVGCVSVEHWWDIHLSPVSVVVVTGLVLCHSVAKD